MAKDNQNKITRFNELTQIMSSEITEEQAIDLYDSKWWEEIEKKQAVILQLKQKRLCMPFGTLHDWTNLLLNRSVWNVNLLNGSILEEVLRLGE